MFTVISKFTVKGSMAMTASVKEAFVNRPHLVESAEGFLRLDVLSPQDTPHEIWLITYWKDRASFETWYKTHAYQEAHFMIPAGLKLETGQTDIRFFDHVGS